MIAAVASDHTWVEKFPGDQMFPNLFVMLLGPSGLGKGRAIDSVLRYTSGMPEVNAWRGKITGAGLSDIFNDTPSKNEDGDVSFGERPTIFLITPEMSMSVGEGPVAKDFCKRVTELFTGGDYEYKERTRTHGAGSFKVPLINWFSGTTVEWLIDSVTRASIVSGFFARIVVVNEDYDFDNLHARPKLPSDARQVVKEIKSAIKYIGSIKGRFKLSNEAVEIHDQWFNSRPRPRDPVITPSWMRADDLIYKTAHILTLCEAGLKRSCDFRIRARHMKRAIAMIEYSHRCLPMVVSYASASKETVGYSTTRDFIQLATRIKHSILLKRVTNRGIHAPQLRGHIDNLRQEGAIEMRRDSNGGLEYIWQSGVAEALSLTRRKKRKVA